METCCPTCSASVSGDYAPGDLVDCPACGATFEARPVRALVSVDDVLHRIERQSAQKRLDEGFEKLGQRLTAERRVEKFDRAIAATERFSKRMSKIGGKMFLFAFFFPAMILILVFAVIVLRSLLRS